MLNRLAAPGSRRIVAGMHGSWRFWSIVPLCLFLQASAAQDAAAQCDPGRPVHEIRQSHTTAVVGWVARTEISAGHYSEHWCLLPGFRNFMSDSTNRTSFTSTGATFNAHRFSSDCQNAGGSYHVATVEQRF